MTDATVMRDAYLLLVAALVHCPGTVLPRLNNLSFWLTPAASPDSMFALGSAMFHVWLAMDGWALLLSQEDIFSLHGSG